MAVTVAGSAVYQWAGAYPLAFSQASVARPGGGATGLLVFFGVASNHAQTDPIVAKHNGKTMTKVGGYSSATGGTTWAFFLDSPDSTGTLTFDLANTYVGAGNATVIWVNGSASTVGAVHGAGLTGSGATGSNALTTTTASPLVITNAFGVSGSTPSLTGSTPTASSIITDSSNSNAITKTYSQAPTTSGTATSTSWGSTFNQANIVAVEICAGGGPATQTLTSTSGISNTETFGTHLVKDPNVSILAPAGIDSNTSALGSPTVSRQVLAIFDVKGTGITISGTPNTVVEKTSGSAAYGVARCSTPVVNGEKKYWEITVNRITTASLPAIGVGLIDVPLDSQLGGYLSDAISWDSSGNARDNNTGGNGRPSFAAGDVLMVAMDMASGWLFMGKNGTWYDGTTPGVTFSTGVGRINATARSTASGLYPCIQTQTVGDKLTANFGRSAFTYTPPTGYTGLDSGGPSNQTLTATAVDFALGTFGSHTVNLLLQKLLPTGADFALGVLTAPTVRQILSPAGLSNAEALGTQAVIQKLAPAGILVTPSLGSPTVVLPAYVLTATSGILASAEALGSHQINLGLSVPGIAPTLALGTPTVAQIMYPGGFLSSVAMGSPTVSLGVWNLTPSGIANGAPAFGSGQINQIITMSGYVNTEAFGTQFVTHIFADADLHPSSITNVSVFGSHQLNQGIKDVGGILAGAAVLGTHEVRGKYPLNPAGIANVEAFGSHKLAMVVSVTGIANVESMGAQLVKSVYTFTPTGILNVEAFGGHSIQGTVWTLNPAGIIDTITLGTPVVNHTVGDSDIYVNVDGLWKPVDKLLVRFVGEWIEIDHILERVSGEWVQIY